MNPTWSKKKTDFLASMPIYIWFTPKSFIAFFSNSVELKARIKSSKAPASTPVSPVPEKPAKAPPPKEVWLAKDQKSHAEGRLVPLKKEISITLHTPKIEGTVENKKDKEQDCGKCSKSIHYTFPIFTLIICTAYLFYIETDNSVSFA